MKNIRKKAKFTCLFMAFTFTFVSCGGATAEKDETTTEETTQTENQVDDVVDDITSTGANLIKLALLLDTSNSMDGLIEQAKSQLWKIVNALSEAQKNGEFAELQISLYEYGNLDLKEEDGFVRQVLPLTDDLDEVSNELFQLNTYGGDEYCGEVIAQSLSDLEWEDSTGGLQVIVIAGNEPFTQGETDYRKSVERAVDSDVIVNTIFCGNVEEGIATNWRDGAEISNGFYGNIEMDEATVYIDTPYDDEINALNSKLNKTYIAYGSQGNMKLRMQANEDQNSQYYGSSNATERTIVKGKKHMYKNQSWDLVDASDEEDFDINKIKESELPEEMKDMNETEKIKYIDKKKKEREKIQDKIAGLAKQRADYIVDEKAKISGEETNHLEDAIIDAIKKQAIAKGFTFEENEAVAQR